MKRATTLIVAFLASVVGILLTSWTLQAGRGGGGSIINYNRGAQSYDNGSPIYQFLSTNGDGTGTTSAIGDYDATPTTFYITPPSGQTYHLERMVISIEDNAAPDAGYYGGNNAALANGYAVERSSSVAARNFELTGGIDIDANADFGRFCYDVDLDAFGQDNDFIQVRWTFAKRGAPLILVGGQDTLKIDFTDDLSFLVAHTFMIQGVSYGN